MMTNKPIIFQTLLFLHEGDAVRSGTLAGEKKKVYVGMKILKNCTGAKLTSFKVVLFHKNETFQFLIFQLKFAIDRALNDRKYEEAAIGPSMKRVMKYWTVRDKFNSVHPDLKEEGVNKIEVTDDGLLFHY